MYWSDRSIHIWRFIECLFLLWVLWLWTQWRPLLRRWRVLLVGRLRILPRRLRFMIKSILWVLLATIFRASISISGDSVGWICLVCRSRRGRHSIGAGAMTWI